MKKLVAVIVFLLSIPYVFAQNVNASNGVKFDNAVSADEASNCNF